MAGLYIHIPFCERKCIYCNFYSIESLDSRDRFLDALDCEITMRADTIDAYGGPARYHTVFFGGGTPSLLSPDQLARIMAALRARFVIDEDAEITMECNPGTLDRSWLEGYRALGVNRLSFGVQSFDDDELRFLSRIHSAAEARSSIEAARRVFENVSLDLIFALPQQTRERWRSNLREGVALGTEHISAYSLIFEEGTKLNALRLAGTVRPVPDALEADMYEETMETLGALGFEQYEVSNYARAGRECRHNVGYWERRSYVSFGPSAHAFLREPTAWRPLESLPESTAPRSLRWANVSSLSSYLGAVESERSPVTSAEVVTPGLAVEELIFLGLRSGGVPLSEFEEIAGCPLDEAAHSDVARLLAAGYASLAEGRLRLTRRGYPFADRFAVELIGAIERSLPQLMSTGTNATPSPLRPSLSLPVVRHGT